jgi:hypothetical protein
MSREGREEIKKGNSFLRRLRGLREKYGQSDRICGLNISGIFASFLRTVE